MLHCYIAKLPRKSTKLISKQCSSATIQQCNHGFTLVELLVAISILAIISTIGMIFYGQATRASKNSRRAQDMRNIATAMELYKTNIGSYPVSTSTQCLKDIAPNPPLVPDYLKVVPEDPATPIYAQLCYRYRSTSDGLGYKATTDPELFNLGELADPDLRQQQDLLDPTTGIRNWAVYSLKGKDL